MAPKPRSAAPPSRRARLAAGAAFAVGALLGALLQRDRLTSLLMPAAGPVDIPGAQPQRQCHLVSVSGLCVEDVFTAIDAAHREQWPGSVDLLVRSSLSVDLFLLGPLFQSVELMWPRGIGDVVLLLGEGGHGAASLVPAWLKVVLESNYLKLPGKMQRQWSYGWADLHTTADFIALLDDDCILIMKVTPSLLFNLTTGAPYTIASAPHQDKQNTAGAQEDTAWSQEDMAWAQEDMAWAPATEFFVGKGSYAANFGAQQPFLVPRGALPAFRAHVAQMHAPEHGSYDQAFKLYSETANETVKFQVQHTTMGNFLLHHMPGKVHVALTGSHTQTPIPRVAAHVPWTNLFLRKQRQQQRQRRSRAKAQAWAKVTDLNAFVASHLALEGLCFSLPPGEAPPVCSSRGIRGVHHQVWRGRSEHAEWRILQGEEKGGSVVYDRHAQTCDCIYWKLVGWRRKNMTGALKGGNRELKSCLK